MPPPSPLLPPPQTASDKEAVDAAIAAAFNDCFKLADGRFVGGEEARAGNAASKLARVQQVADDLLHEFIPGLSLPRSERPVESLYNVSVSVSVFVSVSACASAYVSASLSRSPSFSLSLDTKLTLR